MFDIATKLKNKYQLLQCVPVGSRITCNPAPNTDYDFLCMILENNFWDLMGDLDDDGYELGGSDIEPSEITDDPSWFRSYKNKQNINLIITASEEFFKRFMEASDLAKEENILDKDKRVALFQKVLYNVESFDEDMREYINGIYGGVK